MPRCDTSKCSVRGERAQDMLEAWSSAAALALTIQERDGSTITRRWPLGNMRKMIAIIAEQRKKRGLP